MAQLAVLVDMVTVGLALSGAASRTYALTWYVAPATMLFTLSRFRLGPMKVAVRLVVSRLRALPAGSGQRRVPR